MKSEDRTTHPPALPASGKGAPTTSRRDEIKLARLIPRATNSPH